MKLYRDEREPLSAGRCDDRTGIGDAPHQAEGMARRITKDPEAAVLDRISDPRRAQRQHFTFGFVNVVDLKIEVELL